ncbi:CWC22-involved in mRNA splicing [Fusarium acutatum]|uniref:Pre-mRNA-splicing factor CWC22 n=1 Tax=Fusarium acutatum TaxID=78861 RepID=A0A8H4NU98_9HYPO|nr:CWC22-involved in mRNA splicing [Fusarium acutatum]
MASAEVDLPRRDRDRSDKRDGDSYRPARDQRSASPKQKREAAPVRTEEEKQAAAKAEYEKLLTMRSGGTYIPPARLRALQAQITDKTSKEYQRMAWEALKKSINGLINKVNTANIKFIVPELFGENLIRGRGLFCRSIMKAQAASLPFTPIYAAMAAIVNTKLPQVGELLIRRLVMQFRKGFKRNDKAVCLSSTTFLAHLINQQVQHEMLAGQILLLLLHKPTDDSVEIAVGFCREVGQYLEEMQPSIAMAVFDQFRNILHEADIDKRTQYMIEVLFQVRKDKFKDNPAVKEELDLVEEEDQITHRIELEGEIDVQDGLNIFKFDPEWEEHEEAYKKLKAEILGEGSDDEDDEDEYESSSEDEEDEKTKAMEIKDQSNADLVNLRRTIYLTIMSSADPEEAVHKLMKINLPAGQEPELPSMIVECCSQEKTYTKFFGMIGERFAKINRLWCDLFEQAFAKYYDTIHRYENNKLRNIAMLFGHMFASDALGWHCLSVIHLNEDETTSSSRIFIKILFQFIAEETGMPKLRARMTDETLRPNLEGLFPKDNPRNIRFSINYFTSIGMGALTEEMRTYLQNMPKPALPAPPAADSDSDSVSSYSSYTGSSYSRSRSRSRTPLRRDPGHTQDLYLHEEEDAASLALLALPDADVVTIVRAAHDPLPHETARVGLAAPHTHLEVVPARLHVKHVDARTPSLRKDGRRSLQLEMGEAAHMIPRAYLLLLRENGRGHTRAAHLDEADRAEMPVQPRIGATALPSVMDREMLASNTVARLHTIRDPLLQEEPGQTAYRPHLSSAIPLLLFFPSGKIVIFVSMETPKEPPKASNNATAFDIGIIMIGSKTRNTKARIGTMVLGSLAIGVGSAGLEKLDVDVTMLANRPSRVSNMEYSSVETTNPFEG